MNGFADVLIGNLAPIFLVAAIGFLLRTKLGIEKQSLSKLVFYALTPALIFSSLVNARLPVDEVWQLVLFTTSAVILSGLIGVLLSLLLRLPRQDAVALMLVLMFVNGGNYGLTLNNLRYGEDGLSRATVYYVTSTVLVFTVGVYIASVGKASWSAAFRRLFRLPAFYAVILAIMTYGFSWTVPAPIMSGIDVAAAGSIPVMIVVLGMQIADLKSLDGLRLAFPAAAIRLVAGPLVAVVAARLIGLQGIARSSAIIEASMPTAVITTILATEFDLRPRMVTTVVVLSTLLSAVTLPGVIVLLGL